MSNNVTETLVGGAVLATAIGFLIYASSAVGLSTDPGGLTLKASFRSADGVSVGTDVRLAGVKVGTVTDLRLDHESFRAELAFTVDDRLEIPDDSGVAISQEGLLGGSFVEIIPGASDFAFENGGEFLDTQGSISLLSLLLRFVTAQGD